MDRRLPAFFGACAAMFLFGIVLAVFGVVFGLPEMRERVGLTLIEQGDVFLALFFAVFVSTILVGPIIDSFGNKPVLFTSALLVAVAFAQLSIAKSFAAAISSALLLGFGGGGLNTSSNALVADLYAENRGPMLNIVQTFYGVGALVISLITVMLAGMFTIPQLLWIATSLAALCTIAYAVLPFPQSREAVGYSLLASVRAISIPGVMTFGVLLLCQSGAESSIGGWMSTYAGSIGAAPRTATWIITAHWAALMCGRIVAANIIGRIAKAHLVIGSAISAVIGCVLLFGSTSIALLFAGAIIVGLSFAPVYPTTLAIAADRYERAAGTIFGLLFAVGLSGGMLFPWIAGHVAQNASVRYAMLVPVAGMVVVTAISFSFSRASPRRRLH